MSAPSAVALGAGALAALDGRVAVPGYDRRRIRAGIVHIGVGAFHRAHQAMYLDRLMARGEALDWGVCGVGVLPADQALHDALHAQDCLYTLVLKHPDGTLEPRVVGSVVDFLMAPDNPDAVVERMADPVIRIVSLTVTEGGYADPSSATFELIVEALDRRRRRGVAPFTVVSCDNIQHNGEVARLATVAAAQRNDPQLAAWIAERGRFPSSMVDRITPRTTDADRTDIAARFGVDDRWPVVCEPFVQWVLEDSFAAGRPPLEDAGVQVVADVEPYELMKLRLLNASHQALCYLGRLAGYDLVHEVCQDPLFAGFLLDYMQREATPSLLPVPGIDLDAYRRELIVRFSNPHVRDTVARLCADSSDRIPPWLLPVVRHNLRTGGEVDRSALVVASWARYCEAVDEQGRPIEVVDRLAAERIAAARRQWAEPLAFLENRELFGDLVSDERFTRAYLAALDSLHRRGARATLQSL